MRSLPLTLTQTLGSSSSRSSSRNGAWPVPCEASTRPIWSMTTGTGERVNAGASDPMSSLSM